ncbi:MAG: hypothetical protein AB2693_34170 [Candidatus Thiodiazotropha sp.]
MTQIIQLGDHRQAPKKRPTKKKSSRPQNALSSAERAELDERIHSVACRFEHQWQIKKTIRDDIRKSCGVSRYYHITPSQMTGYIVELNDMEHKAYVFTRLRSVFNDWHDKNIEKVFIECELDLDSFIERVTQ